MLVVLLALLVGILSLAASPPAPRCAAAGALQRAQAAWGRFVDADFVSASAEAEANRASARRELARADGLAAACRPDPTALGRAELHFAIDLVAARRAHASTAALYLLNGDLQTLRALGLPRRDPGRYAELVDQYTELQAEMRGGLAVPAPAAPAAPAPAGCAQPELPPIPRGTISPIVLDRQRLHRTHGATGIAVGVSAEGTVESVLVTMSSGDPVLDDAVASATRLVTFQAARHACRPAPGTYRFSYTFPQY